MLTLGGKNVEKSEKPCEEMHLISLQQIDWCSICDNTHFKGASVKTPNLHYRHSTAFHRVNGGKPKAWQDKKIQWCMTFEKLFAAV